VNHVKLDWLEAKLKVKNRVKNLSRLLPCNTTFREKAVVVKKVVLSFSINMITNSISFLYCLDGSEIFYILRLGQKSLDLIG